MKTDLDGHTHDSIHFDVAIVGAGVVGCALARRLTLDGARVVVLEKAPDVLDGASKGNSAILHTGFDAPPESLEQSCIARGYSEFMAVRETLGLPVLKSGALVLAWDHDQLAQLPGLIEKAKRNGVHDVARLDRSDVLAREPHLSDQVLGGFIVPGESLIDPWTTAHAYLLQALANGASLRRGTEVLSGTFDGERWRLASNRGDLEATFVINCAGLFGDIIDRLIAGESGFTVTPRKGQFVVYDKTASTLTSSILLPVPSEKTKGIVVCRTIFGNLLVGPTAQDQSSRTDASTDTDTLKSLVARGTEMLPALPTHEVTATYAGLRPATEHTDYQIRYLGAKRYVSVGGIRSTGLSASLGIASHVADLISADCPRGDAIEDPVTPAPDRLSEYHPRTWQEPENGGIVCHCERVTRRDIESALAGPMPSATLQGLKRRTRVCMGRCQGFYCLAEVARITRGRIDLPAEFHHDAT